ncbi:SRPBCC family protein [Actinosynnema sp. NPDC059797]
MTPLFEISVRIPVAASVERAYATISDLPRSGEWSVECTGGAWVSGMPGTVGAVFQGENLRAEDVVAWAPVVRGRWRTVAQVVAAEPGKTFSWAMCDSTGSPQDSVWSFDVEPGDEGCVLVHRFRMGAATEGIRGITAGMTDQERQRFFSEWAAKLEQDMDATVRRIKAALEDEVEEGGK